MADPTLHLRVSENGCHISWMLDGRLIEKHFETAVKVVPFTDQTGLLIVEQTSRNSPHNALILETNGSIRVRIANPEAHHGAICFGDAYYVGAELTLIICFSSWQMACVIDQFGNIRRTYETR